MKEGGGDCAGMGNSIFNRRIRAGADGHLEPVHVYNLQPYGL